MRLVEVEEARPDAEEDRCAQVRMDGAAQGVDQGDRISEGGFIARSPLDSPLRADGGIRFHICDWSAGAAWGTVRRTELLTNGAHVRDRTCRQQEHYATFAASFDAARAPRRSLLR